MVNLRTFIAIDVKVDRVLKSKWHELKALLNNDSIKWVDEQSLHLTLFFLGNTPIDMVDDIAQKLELALQSSSSFKISLQGFGIFGNPKTPRVIWVGVASSKPLLTLMQVVRTTISSLAFDEPEGVFSPHFTLGRVRQLKSSSELNSYIDRNKSEILQEVDVERVVFYQSVLTPTGPIYKPLKEIKLLSP